jgi:DNA-binding NtrC family response regulator
MHLHDDFPNHRLIWNAEQLGERLLEDFQMFEPTIAVIDDDKNAARLLCMILEDEGYHVVVFNDPEAVLNTLSEADYDLFLVDYRMPKMDGIELLGRLKKYRPEAVVVMITAFGTIEVAVKAMQLGAYDFITKPLDRDGLKLTVHNALRFAELQAENRHLREALTDYSWPGNVRELENLIESALVFSDGGEIRPEHLPDELYDFPDASGRAPESFANPTHPLQLEIPDEGISLLELEKSLVQKALEKTGGNQTQAAKLLGLKRHALIYRMEKFQLSHA